MRDIKHCKHTFQNIVRYKSCKFGWTCLSIPARNKARFGEVFTTGFYRPCHGRDTWLVQHESNELQCNAHQWTTDRRR